MYLFELVFSFSLDMCQEWVKTFFEGFPALLKTRIIRVIVREKSWEIYCTLFSHRQCVSLLDLP